MSKNKVSSKPRNFAIAPSNLCRASLSKPAFDKKKICCLKIGQKRFELSQTLTAHFEEKTIQSKELSTTRLSFFTDTDLLAFD